MSDYLKEIERETFNLNKRLTLESSNHGGLSEVDFKQSKKAISMVRDAGYLHILKECKIDTI